MGQRGEERWGGQGGQERGGIYNTFTLLCAPKL